MNGQFLSPSETFSLQVAEMNQGRETVLSPNQMSRTNGKQTCHVALYLSCGADRNVGRTWQTADAKEMVSRPKEVMCLHPCLIACVSTLRISTKRERKGRMTWTETKND